MEYTRPATWGDLKILGRYLEGLLQTKQGLRPKDRMDAAVIAAAIRAMADQD